MDWLIPSLLVGILIAEVCRAARLKRTKGMARTAEEHRFALSAYLLLVVAWPLILVVAIVTGVATKVFGK